ncbi:MAG: cyclase family protein [Candidatus Lambdaproteobacteria bacterium]|nr:cyclase family protein [Candidatus Lambdaproteobacteria bacterium]
MAAFPKYRELKRPDPSGLPLSWGAWGPADELGILNNITEAGVRDAARLVRRGVRFNLDLPLHHPHGLLSPGSHRRRGAPTPTMYERADPDSLGRDDKLDGFFLQASSQWDGLTHYGDVRHGFYNHVKAEQVTHGAGSKNGIDKVAEFGLVGRGVLADIPRHFAKIGRPWQVLGGHVVSAEDLAACLAEQAIALRQGDILLVRLGWVSALLGEQDQAQRDHLFKAGTFSGLSGQEDMWEFIWDHRLAAVATDTVTVEVWPRSTTGPSLHLGIARMGFTIGEMFALDKLADDCARDGVREFLFTSSPLNLRGGVGSPPNAIAVK